MRARRAMAIPALAALAVSGALALGGCGSSSDAATTDQAKESTQQGDAMKHEGGAMKDEGGAMKHGGAMKDESSGDHMEG